MSRPGLGARTRRQRFAVPRRRYQMHVFGDLCVASALARRLQRLAFASCLRAPAPSPAPCRIPLVLKITAADASALEQLTDAGLAQSKPSRCPPYTNGPDLLDNQIQPLAANAIERCGVPPTLSVQPAELLGQLLGGAGKACRVLGGDHG